MEIKHTEDVAVYPVPLLDNPQGKTCEVEIGNPFGPLLLESYPHDGQSRLSWDVRSTLSSKKY